MKAIKKVKRCCAETELRVTQEVSSQELRIFAGILVIFVLAMCMFGCSTSEPKSPESSPNRPLTITKDGTYIPYSLYFIQTKQILQPAPVIRGV